MNETTADELCELIGEDAMERIRRRFGGCRVYIPHAPRVKTQKIVADFNRVIHSAASVGVAYETVAHENDVSPRTVRRIICGGN